MSLDRTEKSAVQLPSLGLLALLVIVGSAGLFWQFTQQSPRLWSADHYRTVSLAGSTYRVDEDTFEWLLQTTLARFSVDDSRLREQVQAEVNARVDSSFSRVRERLPLFADWYYSLPGEYSRLAMSALSAANLVEGDFLARRAAALLFPDPLWQASFEGLETASQALIEDARAASRARWLQEVSDRLSPLKVGQETIASPRETESLTLDVLDRSLQEAAITPWQTPRVAVSSIAGASMAGTALWRVAVARNALGSARVAGAMSARGGARVGSAATGALVCAPGGPLAIACAAGVGIATWVATDWLLLEVDEAVSREAMEAALLAGLNTLQEALKAEILAAYDARVEAISEASQQHIAQTFVLREGASPTLQTGP